MARTDRPLAQLIGYANGYPGYLPDREAYRCDRRYEVMVSPVDAGSGERVVWGRPEADGLS